MNDSYPPKCPICGTVLASEGDTMEGTLMSLTEQCTQGHVYYNYDTGNSQDYICGLVWYHHYTETSPEEDHRRAEQRLWVTFCKAAYQEQSQAWTFIQAAPDSKLDLIVTLGIFADWLSEHNQPAVEALLRKHMAQEAQRHEPQRTTR